jgi:ubiquinol-cytochrome c reductase cytochrome c subunit
MIVLKRAIVPRSMFAGWVIPAFLLVPFALQIGFCQAAESTAPPNGEAVFAVHCAKCHGYKGEGVDAEVTIAGPCLQAEHDAGRAMTAMEAGQDHMPSFAYILSVAEMRAAAQYVTQTLAVMPLEGGNLSEGGKLFREYCAECHRTAARGGALAFTGTNAPELTGKSPAIVAGAIRMGPGPMPSFPSFVLDDKQVDSIVQYVDFIQKPPNPGGNPLHYYGPVAEGFAGWIVLFGLGAVAGWIEKGGKG